MYRHRVLLAVLVVQPYHPAGALPMSATASATPPRDPREGIGQRPIPQVAYAVLRDGIH